MSKRLSFTEGMHLFRGGGDAPTPRDDSNEPPPESVTELAARMRGALEGLGERIRVRGEVSNFVDKNHWYFSLKDDESVVQCAMWQSDVARTRWRPKEGDDVIATGSVSFYPKQGRAQLYVRKLERVGMGSLQERFEALCRELRELGYFDEERKLPLPTFCRRVAVITSATGAAIHDCMRTAALRCPAIGIVHVDVRVQGDGAAEEIARAIAAVDRAATTLGIDAIVVTRGGGSIEDLWAFNERVVADAILNRRNCPIVAAIGHESDVTIAELVADRRASTPTQAMTLLVPDREDLREFEAQLKRRLVTALARAISARKELLERIGRSATFRFPRAIVDMRRDRLRPLGHGLRHALSARIHEARSSLSALASALEQSAPTALASAAREGLGQRGHRLARALLGVKAAAMARLAALERHLEAVAPGRVLARGYTYTTTRDGLLVRRVADAPAGSRIVTHVSDGTIDSTVEGATRGGPRKKPAADGTDAPLFG